MHACSWQNDWLKKILLACDLEGTLLQGGGTLSGTPLDGLLKETATLSVVRATVQQRHYLCRGCASLCTDVFVAAPPSLVTDWNNGKPMVLQS